jgi:hypothetical protein
MQRNICFRLSWEGLPAKPRLAGSPSNITAVGCSPAVPAGVGCIGKGGTQPPLPTLQVDDCYFDGRRSNKRKVNPVGLRQDFTSL